MSGAAHPAIAWVRRAVAVGVLLVAVLFGAGTAAVPSSIGSASPVGAVTIRAYDGGGVVADSSYDEMPAQVGVSAEASDRDMPIQGPDHRLHHDPLETHEARAPPRFDVATDDSSTTARPNALTADGGAWPGMRARHTHHA